MTDRQFSRSIPYYLYSDILQLLVPPIHERRRMHTCYTVSKTFLSLRVLTIKKNYHLHLHSFG